MLLKSVSLFVIGDESNEFSCTSLLNSLTKGVDLIFLWTFLNFSYIFASIFPVQKFQDRITPKPVPKVMG